MPTPVTDVYFFATCVVDQFFPGAGLDAIRLLEDQGITVHFPENQTCCGQPAYSSGFHEEARQVARLQLGLFPEPWPVVVPSGSCAGMMKHHYPTLFAGDPVYGAKAEELSSRVYEFTEFLVKVPVARQEHEAECCGFGGTFSVRHPEISAAMVSDKVNALKATGAERVVSADCGCLMNILGHAAWKDQQEGRSQPSLPGEHIASFLRKRTGGAR